MIRRRLPAWMLLAAVAGLVIAGCEPYMSMTDRIPAQTRTATALLPEAPRYAGMVDLATVVGQLDEFSNMNLADSLRQTDNERLRAFLDATGMDPETDLKALYGAIGGEDAFSAVVFADLSPEQLDRYLDRAPEGSGRATTYRDVPVYHLALGTEPVDATEVSDTLSVAFVGNGTIATSTDAEAVTAMVDRHRTETGGLRGNQSYMTLVEKVGHGSTAWLVGRDVLQTALRDSAGGPAPSPEKASGRSMTMNSAGFQRLLSGWADRVLGMSEGTPSLEGSTGSKVKKLKSRIREQAVSLTLTDESLDGEVYLTMRDETSASNVVDVSKGALAALRLSEREVEGLKGDLLDGVNIERNGPVVHIRFAVARTHLQNKLASSRDGRAARQSMPAIHRVKATVRRLTGITPGSRAVGVLRKRGEPCNLYADRPVLSIARATADPAPEQEG